ncbi:MAG: hypothetical protein PWP23_2061 [Candidatus Sumerlaeota bacterium]|nr:hypothetical protein [Candidatus Sumerlaeota bacterium]
MIVRRGSFPSAKTTRPQELRLILGALLLLSLTAIAGGQDFNQDAARLERERQIEAKTALLRTLHTQGRYEEVVATARELLELDPDNMSATVWLDRAQVKIETEGSKFPGFGTGTSTSDLPPPDPFAAPDEVQAVTTPAATPEPTPEAIAAPTFVPAPLAPRKKESVFSSLLSPMVLIIVGVVALLLILISIFAVIRMKKSQRQLQQAIEEEERKRAAQPPIRDLHDAVTQYSALDAPTDQHQADLADDDSVMQFGEVGTSRDTADEDTLNFARERQQDPTAVVDEDKDTLQLASQPAADAKQDEDDGAFSIPFTPPVEEEEKPAPPPPAADPASGGGDTINLGSLSDPDPQAETNVSESSEDGGGDLSFNSLMFDPSGETQQSAPPPEEKESFTNVMFSDAEETVAPGASGAAGGQDDQEMTYNSLMFSGEGETQMPGMGAETPPLPPDDKDDPQSYTSLMFSGADETVMGDAPTTMEQGGSDLEKALDETIRIDAGLGSDGSADQTIPMPDPEKKD